MSEDQLIQTPCVFGENGNFLLERELGKGGMGGVYLGRDKMLDRPVAVKVMLKEYGSDAGFVDRFKKEAQAVARLIHPNIAQVYSYGIADGMPYIAMELVAGGSLDQIMRNSGANSDIPRILKICEQVAQALRCASDQGLVHGDIKPENILLDANGNAKIVDFGLVAMQHDTDEIWGTPYYIAPEKVRKDAVDYRADIYSLGGTLYHALCGVAPFEGDDAMTVVKKRFEFIPRKPSEIRSELSPQIDALVMKMLAFNPADRYPSFEALLADFKAVMTVGLSSSQIMPSNQSAEENTTTKTSGKKKILLKSKKKISLKPSAASSNKTDSENDGQLDEDLGDNSKKTSSSDVDEEEESGGNIGLKVALFIGIIIAVIGIIAGGLWFITEHSAKSAAEAINAEIRTQVDLDKNYLEQVRQKVQSRLSDVEELSKSVMDKTQKFSDDLASVFKNSEQKDLFANLKPNKTEELLKAEAALIEKAPEDIAPVADASNTNEVAKVASEAAPTNEPPKAPEAVAVVEPNASQETSPHFTKMQEFWKTTYSIQARILGIKKEFIDLSKKIDNALSNIAYNNEIKASLRSIVTEVEPLTKSLDGKISEVKKDFNKNISAIRKLYEKAKSDEERRLFQNEVKERAEAKKRQEEEREQKEKEEYQQLVNDEIDRAKSTFETQVANGTFRRAMWKEAERDFKALANSFKTPEGRHRVQDFELKKVYLMKFLQSIFIENMKANGGYIFTSKVYKNKFFDKIVVSANESDFVLINKNKIGTTSKYSWQTIFTKYPLAMNELWKKYVLNGRENGVKKLTLKDWSEAQLGFAMILKIVCPSVEGAEKVYRQCAMDAVRKFPRYKTLAADIFPEIDFSVIEAEAAANDL